VDRLGFEPHGRSRCFSPGKVLTNREHIIALEPMEKGSSARYCVIPTKGAIRRSISTKSRTSKSPRTCSTLPSIVNQKSGRYEPEKFEDEYETALIDLINQKRSGKPITPKERPATGNVIP
jgi:DNA end-binding protein Ku